MAGLKIIFIAPTPPPYMGPSVATEVVLNSKFAEEFDIVHIDTADRRSLNNLGKVDITNVTLALKHYFMLFWKLLTAGADVVYIPISQTTVGFLRDVPFIYLSKLFGKRVVLHLRGGYFKEFYRTSGVVMRFIIRRALKTVDRMIVLGHSLKGLFEGLIPEGRISVVPNGLDLDCAGAGGGGKDGFVRVLFLSNLIRTKGLFETLESVKPVTEKFDNVKYQFAGSWKSERERAEAETYVKSAGISRYVEFLGPVVGRQKLSLLCGADIFAFPTYYPMEGHPWVIVEAMAAGLPIVSTDQGAIGECVVDGVNGFIVEKKNPSQVAEKINLLVGDPAMRRQMGEASLRLHRDKFTEAKFIDNMIGAVRAALADAPNEAPPGGQRNVKALFNDKPEAWSSLYSSEQRHFAQRARNVHILVKEFQAGAEILDIGCGTGEITASIHKKFRGRTTGIDIAEKMIAHCAGRYHEDGLHFEIGDITRLDFASGRFDLVLSLSVLEWVEDPEKAVSEVARVLKPGGQWIVSIPNWASIFRKSERALSRFSPSSYLHYHKNDMSVRQFKEIALGHGLKEDRSIYHVVPLYCKNLPRALGPLMGMMCMLSMSKS